MNETDQTIMCFEVNNDIKNIQNLVELIKMHDSCINPRKPKYKNYNQYYDWDDDRLSGVLDKPAPSHEEIYHRIKSSKTNRKLLKLFDLCRGEKIGIDFLLEIMKKENMSVKKIRKELKQENGWAVKMMLKYKGTKS